MTKCIDRTRPELEEFAQEMRASYRAMIPMAGAPDAVAGVEDISIDASGSDRRIPLRIYTPAHAVMGDVLPVVLFVHGGGFVSGDLDTHDVLVRAIANRVGAVTVSVGYRLAPEHAAPAGLDDVFAVLAWIAAHAGEIGGDGTRICVCGDSAGANLAASVALTARDRGGPRIRVQWLMYPIVSNRMDTASWSLFGDVNFPTREVNAKVIACYVPEGMGPDDPMIAPLRADHAGLPPTLVQVGELDPLRDDDVAYAEALTRAGGEARTIVYAGQKHGFIQFFKDRENNAEGEAALDAGARYVRAKLVGA